MRGHLPGKLEQCYEYNLIKAGVFYKPSHKHLIKTFVAMNE